MNGQPKRSLPTSVLLCDEFACAPVKRPKIASQALVGCPKFYWPYMAAFYWASFITFFMEILYKEEHLGPKSTSASFCSTVRTRHSGLSLSF